MSYNASYTSYKPSYRPVKEIVFGYFGGNMGESPPKKA